MNLSSILSRETFNIRVNTCNVNYIQLERVDEIIEKFNFVIFFKQMLYGETFALVTVK